MLRGDDELCDGRTPFFSRKARALVPLKGYDKRSSDSEPLAREEIGYGLSNRRSRSLFSRMVFVNLSLPDAENAFLGDNVVRVHPHMVQSSLDKVLDFLYARLIVGSVGRFNPEHVSIDSHFGFEFLLQEPR